MLATVAWICLQTVIGEYKWLSVRQLGPQPFALGKCSYLLNLRTRPLDDPLQQQEIGADLVDSSQVLFHLFCKVLLKNGF
jgi:hypothetical protein